MSSRSMALLAAQLLAALVFSDATAERLPIRTYTTEEGLAHARVRRIVRDPRGFLWFCTVDGLSRFDGSEFITYRGADGLPDPWVSDLLVARDGTYWVATNDGVVKFAPHLWRAGSRDRGSDGDEAPHLFQDVPLEETPLLSKEIRALLQDRAGRVWAGGLGGLFLLDTSGPAPRFRHVVPSPEAMVTRLLDGADGTLWIGTMGGLFERSLSGRVLAVPSAVGAGVLHVRGLAADLAGRLWVGHDEGLLVLGPSAGRPEHMSASAVRRPRNCGSGHGGQRRLRLPEGDDACIVTVADGLLDRRVRTIEIGSNGHVRVGTVAGLNDFDGVSITRMTAAQGLVDETINAIAEDRDGNVWIGTDSGGVLRVAAFGFVSYFPADGLQIEYTPSLIEGDAGRVIAVAGASFTLSEFDGRRFVPTRFNIPRVMPRDRFFSTLRDHLGAWWLGTPSGLLEYPSPRRLVDLARLQPLVHALGRHELPSDDLFPLFEDERGDIWLSARLPDRLKLLRWRRATDDFQIYGAKDGLADGTARPAVVAGLAGQLFVGFEEAGLFVYRDGRFSAILDGARRMGVMRLHVDRLGRLWIFRTDGAVSRIDDLSGYGVVRDEMVQRSLMGARVRCVVEDARGHLFMGTASGVVEVDPGTGGTWRYTTAEGLAQNEVLSALVSRRGEVWFGTVSGVSRLQAVPPRRTRHVPEVYITTVRVNAGARLVSALGEREVPGLTLEPDERHVSIDYFGLTFAPGEPLQYQYRLDGADRDWSAPTPLRRVNYAQLSPGTYRFQVRAVTLSGTSGAEPASLRFRILAPVWRRWWFITAAGAIAVGLGTMLHRYRVAQLVAIERVRTRIATDLHDDIGASLSQIAILSELARGEADTRPETADTLGRIAATSRELVESMGDIVWSINPARDRVGDLLQRMRRFASDTFTGRNIDFGFQASEVGRELALAADLRREVLLIFKESVNNIVRHARCRRAEIDVRIEGEALVVSVADDGQGLPTQGDPLDGHGLPSMRERAARLGGSLVIDSSPGRGTTLVLRVPLRRAGRTS